MHRCEGLSWEAQDQGKGLGSVSKYWVELFKQQPTRNHRPGRTELSARVSTQSHPWGLGAKLVPPGGSFEDLPALTSIPLHPIWCIFTAPCVPKF